MNKQKVVNLQTKPKIKIEDLKEDAKELWNKVANKFDKEENKNTTPPQENSN